MRHLHILLSSFLYLEKSATSAHVLACLISSVSKLFDQMGFFNDFFMMIGPIFVDFNGIIINYGLKCFFLMAFCKF